MPTGPRGFVAGQSRELTDARTAKSKTFANPDGTRTTEFYETAIHVDDGTGHLVDVDPNLLVVPGGFETSRAPVTNHIDSNLDTGWIETRSGGHRVAIRPNSIAATAGSATGPRTVTFGDVAPGTDLVVDALPIGMKADFVVSDSASMRGAYSYQLQSDLTPVSAPDGSIEFRDEGGQGAFSVPRALAYDADANPELLPAECRDKDNNDNNSNGNRHDDKCEKDWGRCRDKDDSGNNGNGNDNDNNGNGNDNDNNGNGNKHDDKCDDPSTGVGEVGLTFSGSPGNYTITATPDPAWLADPKRTYPVTIDPAFNWFVRADTFVSSSSPNSNFWSFESNGVPGTNHAWTVVRRVGQHPSYGDNRTLLSLTPNDAQAGSMAEIIDANITTYALYNPNPGAHPWWTLPTSDWSPYSATWNNEPSYAPSTTVGRIFQRTQRCVDDLAITRADNSGA